MLRSGDEPAESALEAQERDRMRAGRQRWFTEERGARRTRRGSRGVGAAPVAAAHGDGSTGEGDGASTRGRGRHRPGRGHTDPGVDIDLVVADADALVVARPDRPRAARVPVHKGPRARRTVAPPTAAGAALAAREEELPLPQRRAPNTVSIRGL